MKFTPERVKRIVTNIEIASSVFMLWYFLGVSLLPSGPMNAFSYGILILLISWRWKQFLYVVTRSLPVQFLFLLSIASLVWSQAPDVTQTEIRVLVRATFFAAYLAARFKIEDLIKIFTWTFSLATILSLLTGLALPAIGTHGGDISSPWKGIFGYKNTLASVSAISGVLFLCIPIRTHKKSWFAWLGFAAATALVILSQSKTGLVIFLFLVSLLPLYKFIKQQYKVRAILLLIAMLIGITVAIIAVTRLESIIVNDLGKDLTFNGRTPIWELASQKGMEKPWLGYGFSGFWTSDAGLFVVNNTWAAEEEDLVRFNAHNSFLELFIQVGFIGCFLYALDLITVFWRLIILILSTRKIEFFLALILIINMLLAGLSDSGNLLTSTSAWIIYLTISFSSLLNYNWYLSHRST